MFDVQERSFWKMSALQAQALASTSSSVEGSANVRLTTDIGSLGRAFSRSAFPRGCLVPCAGRSLP